MIYVRSLTVTWEHLRTLMYSDDGPCRLISNSEEKTGSAKTPSQSLVMVEDPSRLVSAISAMSTNGSSSLFLRHPRPSGCRTAVDVHINMCTYFRTFPFLETTNPRLVQREGRTTHDIRKEPNQ